MQIAILGTRGIPNRYGGFERFAEVVSQFFAQSGHEVWVLSESNDESNIKGVNIVYISTPRCLRGNLSTLLYDLKSMLWAKRNKPDIILQCGYSFACWLPFFGASISRRIVTNPDGLEFRRKKWNGFAKMFLHFTERIAVKMSAAIVADNPQLTGYFVAKYGISPAVIPYGSFICDADASNFLEFVNIPSNYFLVVSRPTPENSIHEILQTFSKNGKNLVVVGSFSNSDYGRNCLTKYSNCKNIIFTGGIYEQTRLNYLRKNAVAYVHGHTVGGTNPSLLEAMGCGCFVIAHKNIFNEWVLNNNGLFFDDKNDLESCINLFEKLTETEVSAVKMNNIKRIKDNFVWESVSEQYIELFGKILLKQNRK